MLEKVKRAIRITGSQFDGELSDLISAALCDLGIIGVIVPEETDPLITRAVITYCRANFGQPPNYEQLKKSYDEQKAQLSMADGYTDWGDNT